jgi:hypothetical protein
MIATKNFVFDIADEIRTGELSFAQIAERFDCDIETVNEVFDYMMDMEQDQYEPDYEDDGDALASAGWGTDEDYGYYGEEF